MGVWVDFQKDPFLGGVFDTMYAIPDILYYFKPSSPHPAATCKGRGGGGS